MKYIALFLSLFALPIAALTQSNNVIFTFQPMANGAPMTLNETIFPIHNGKMVKITRAQFYLSKMALKTASGSAVPLTDVILLVNASDPATEYPAGAWPISAVSGVNLNMGVDSAHNHLDPSVYPADDPLAPQNPAMHWGWSAGYRFLAIEGEVDNDGDGVPETHFEYHSLGDALYAAIQITGAAVAVNGTLHLDILVDYALFFEGYALTSNLIQHGSGPQNSKMMGNVTRKGVLEIADVLKIDQVTLNARHVAIWPNPVVSSTNIQYDLPVSNGSMTLVITNNIGQPARIVAGLPAAGAVVLGSLGLAAGIYTCVFLADGQLVARKQFVVVQ